MRVDKWLWTARLFKTRALAAEAVKGGRVHVNGVAVKPAREVGPGDDETENSVAERERQAGAPDQARPPPLRR